MHTIDFHQDMLPRDTPGQFFPVLKIKNISSAGNVQCVGGTAVDPDGVCVGGTTNAVTMGLAAAIVKLLPQPLFSSGTCASFNTCECDPNRVGADCSIVDCPKDTNEISAL